MELTALLTSVRNYYKEISENEIKKISEAFFYLQENDSPQDRQQAESILSRMLDLEAGVDTICTALILCFSTHDSELDQEFYTQEIRFLHENLEKLDATKIRSETEDSENIKRIFIALSKDIRVLILHLSRYLWRLKNIQNIDPERREILARIGLKIHAPIAEKLDMYLLKAELEDASFAILQPDLYTEILSQSLGDANQQGMIQNAVTVIQDLLAENDFAEVVVEGRKKNIYSIYEKMKRKNFHFVKEVYDLFAVRIITHSPEGCYHVLGLIHTHFTPMENRFKDFIAVPKANGYRSLHTTVLGLGINPNPTEIQIQDSTMYRQARYGSAAHWAYKKARSSEYTTDFLKNYNWVDDEKETGELSPEEIFDDITQKVNTERIHIFTPKGDIINLPKDATPVDFAFAIHSEIGYSIVNAKVNGHIKPLNYELKSGDVVEVITKKGRTPNPFWLTFIKSQNAKGKIRSFLNKERSFSEPKEDPTKEKSIPKQPLRRLGIQKTKSAPSKIMIGGETDIPYRFASCCDPIYPNPIIAYNSRGLEFVIHDANCKMLSHLEEARFMKADFIQTKRLQILCHDRFGLLKEICDLIYDENINITQTNYQHPDEGNVEIAITVEYTRNDQLQRLKEDLEKIPNVVSVSYTESQTKK